MEVDVLIPVYRPDGKLTELLKRLKMQNYPIHRVILMNTEEKHFPAELTGIWIGSKYIIWQKKNLIMAGPETGESACRQQIWWSA